MHNGERGKKQNSFLGQEAEKDSEGVIATQSAGKNGPKKESGRCESLGHSALCFDHYEIIVFLGEIWGGDQLIYLQRRKIGGETEGKKTVLTKRTPARKTCRN